MKKYPHQIFMQENQIDIEALPAMLQKRIKGFDELQEDYELAVDEDQLDLKNKLENLSQELEQDLEEHFEEHLENNDEEELSEEEMEVQSEPEPEQEKQQVEEPTIEPEPKEPTDEEIIQGFYDKRKYTVAPAELRSKGLKTVLTQKVHRIGKFFLSKGKYDTKYRISQ